MQTGRRAAVMDGKRPRARWICRSCCGEATNQDRANSTNTRLDWLLTVPILACQVTDQTNPSVPKGGHVRCQRQARVQGCKDAKTALGKKSYLALRSVGQLSLGKQAVPSWQLWNLKALADHQQQARLAIERLITDNRESERSPIFTIIKAGKSNKSMPNDII